MPAKQPAMYLPQKKLLQALGARLRLARLRRKLGIDLTCERAGISRMTLYRAEQGNSALAIGTLLRLLSVLGMESDLEQIARDDKLGRLLQDHELTSRRRARVTTPHRGSGRGRGVEGSGVEGDGGGGGVEDDDHEDVP